MLCNMQLYITLVIDLGYFVAEHLVVLGVKPVPNFSFAILFFHTAIKAVNALMVIK